MFSTCSALERAPVSTLARRRPIPQAGRSTNSALPMTNAGSFLARGGENALWPSPRGTSPRLMIPLNHRASAGGKIRLRARPGRRLSLEHEKQRLAAPVHEQENLPLGTAVRLFEGSHVRDGSTIDLDDHVSGAEA